jgi:GT2 family glycosyltransferase
VTRAALALPLRRARRRHLSRVVTVIMKTFQRPRTAALAVDHLRRRYPEIRLLVADDGSDALAFAHPGAEVLRLPFDSGVSQGRNALLARVETEFFVLIDDDHCFSRHTRLERMLAILQRGRFDILGGDVFFRRPTQRLFPKRKLSGFCMNVELEDGTFSMRAAPREATRAYRVYDVVENFFLARTQRVRAFGGWDERLKTSEHFDFFLRARRAGLRVGSTSRVSVDHVHLQRERRSPEYFWFRRDRNPDFRRIWIEQHGIRRFVDRDGSAYSAEAWISRENLRDTGTP